MSAQGFPDGRQSSAMELHGATEGVGERSFRVLFEINSERRVPGETVPSLFDLREFVVQVQGTQRILQNERKRLIM